MIPHRISWGHWPIFWETPWQSHTLSYGRSFPMGSDEAVSPFSGRSYGNLIPYERPSPIGSHGAIKFSSFSGGSYGSLIPYEGPSRASWDLTETSLLAHFLGDPMEISHLMRDHFPRISRGHWLIFWKILWESHTLWGIIFHSLDPQS
jgi:hypothetical protein